MTQRFYVPGTQRGVYGNLVLWVGGTLAIIVAVALVVGGVRWVTAPASGKLQARRTINSGAFRITAYNHFFDLCASIQGLEGQLTAQKSELGGASADDRDRIQANVAGIQGARAQAIAEYNADAQKSYTLGQFRSSHLPFQLDPNGASTTCVA